MEILNPSINTLFEQLGLEGSDEAIADFVKLHAPLPDAVKLHEAEFWNRSQAALLEQAIDDDAGWAEVVDHLDAQLRVQDL